MSRKDSVVSPHSNFKEAILIKLKELGYIKDYSVTNNGFKKINILLLFKGKAPAITDIKICSTPGKRVYISYKQLKPVINNLGYSILSTAKGILTNKEAKKQKVGGELLFNIW